MSVNLAIPLDRPRAPAARWLLVPAVAMLAACFVAPVLLFFSYGLRGFVGGRVGPDWTADTIVNYAGNSFHHVTLLEQRDTWRDGVAADADPRLSGRTLHGLAAGQVELHGHRADCLFANPRQHRGACLWLAAASVQQRRRELCADKSGLGRSPRATNVQLVRRDRFDGACRNTLHVLPDTYRAYAGAATSPRCGARSRRERVRGLAARRSSALVSGRSGRGADRLHDLHQRVRLADNSRRRPRARDAGHDLSEHSRPELASRRGAVRDAAASLPAACRRLHSGAGAGRMASR